MEQAAMTRREVTTGEVQAARIAIREGQTDQATAVEAAVNLAGTAARMGPGVIKARLFRKMADTLATQVQKLRGPRLENTPKRQREAAGARIDAKNLERVQRALLALADGHERGTVPDSLAELRYQKEIAPLVRRLSDTSGGYYSIVESDQWACNTEQAKELRAFVAEWQRGHFAEVDAERARAEKVQNLENSVRFSDIPGFFPTPADLIENMIAEADLEPGMMVLEPSAGKGDIADACKAAGCKILCFEINHSLAEILRAKGHDVERCDCLAVARVSGFDRVIMNPPFENGQDMDHVRAALDWVKPGGRLVAIVSAGSRQNSTKKAEAFQQWLMDVGATSYENDPDAFKGAFRSTGVHTWTIVIDKD